MTRREIEEAIRRELESWPGATVEFVDGGKHPKAKLMHGGLMLSTSYASTSGTSGVIRTTLGSIRRVLKQLGAERTKPEPSADEDEAPYRKPNRGAEMRPDPVEGELAKLKPDVADQMVARGMAMPGQAAAARLPAMAREPAPALEAEPLGPGEHDIPAERYHADPCPEPSLSASLAKKAIEQSLWHAANSHPRLNDEHEEKDKLTYRIGRAFHSMLLGAGAEVEVYDYKDWKKDIAKADRDSSLARGCTPLLTHQFEATEAMVRAAKAQMRRREELAYAMSGGRPERTFIWIEPTPSGPVYCRMMADWTPHAGQYAVDWKTTKMGAGPADWGQRAMWDQGCDIQDAFYRRGYKAVLGVDFEALIFAVVEQDAPHAMMHHRIMGESQHAADMEVQWAINAWAACLKHGRWPGYPVQMAWQEKPGWRAGRIDARWESGQRDLELLDAQLAALAEIKATPLRDGTVPQDDDNPFGLPPIDDGEPT